MDQDLLEQLANLPLPSATAGKRKRKPTVKATETLDERLLRLEPKAVVAPASDNIAVLREKANRLDKIRQLLLEQANAESRYRALENEVMTLIRKK